MFNEKDVKATEDAEKIELESGVEEENIIDVIKPLQPKPIKRSMIERLAPDQKMRQEMKTVDQKTIKPIQIKQYTAEDDEKLRQLIDELFKYR